MAYLCWVVRLPVAVLLHAGLMNPAGPVNVGLLGEILTRARRAVRCWLRGMRPFTLRLTKQLTTFLARVLTILKGQVRLGLHVVFRSVSTLIRGLPLRATIRLRLVVTGVRLW